MRRAAGIRTTNAAVVNACIPLCFSVESQAKRESERGIDRECEIADIDMPARKNAINSIYTPHGKCARARARDAMY